MEGRRGSPLRRFLDVVKEDMQNVGATEDARDRSQRQKLFLNISGTPLWLLT